LGGRWDRLGLSDMFSVRGTDACGYRTLASVWEILSFRPKDSMREGSGALSCVNGALHDQPL
jgi:hypothetical protein